jgi:hypothetical protein
MIILGTFLTLVVGAVLTIVTIVIEGWVAAGGLAVLVPP